MRVRIVLSPNNRSGAAAEFLSPLPVPVRAAVLLAGFAETTAVRVFPDGWSREVEQYEPQLLAAPLAALRLIAARAASRRIWLGSLDSAVVAFTGPSEPCLTEGDRDFFWRVFQVPLFEQYLDAAGRLLAAECDAHQGLHLRRRGTAVADLDGRIETAPCPCGRPGPRLFRPRDTAAPARAAMRAAAGR